MRQSSIVIRISIALAGIVALSVATMLTSYWISDKGNSDAAAINIAGSLRAKSYELGMLAMNPSASDAQKSDARERLTKTWHHPIFNSLRHDNSRLATTYATAFEHSQALQDLIASGISNNDIQPMLDQQMVLLNQLVSGIQQHAEGNAYDLRLVQVTALFLILILSAIVIYWLKVKVEMPLSELTQAATRVGEGDFSYRIPTRELDELGILGRTLNRMSEAIAHMHEQMEDRIEQQTHALQRSNTALQFLYDTAKCIIEQEPGGINYDRIVTQLSHLTEVENIEVCLMTEAGDSPYLQFIPTDNESELCATKNCFSCLKGEVVNIIGSVGEANPHAGLCRYSFPMLYEQRNYGVLVCLIPLTYDIHQWQNLLF